MKDNDALANNFLYNNRTFHRFFPQMCFSQGGREHWNIIICGTHNHITSLVGLTILGLLLNLDWSVQTVSVQTFQTII